MAGGRSFKPASYLASAVQRPPFTRNSSASSTKSTEDPMVTSLKHFILDDNHSRSKENTSPGRSHHHPAASVTRTPSEDRNHKSVTTPGRNRSAPITIELPGRDPRAVYTPLSARGDLPGGYFPNHEEIQRSYKSHPFHNPHDTKTITLPEAPFAMSVTSTPISESIPNGPQSILSPGYPPEVLSIPLGKYHPSNFKSQASSSTGTPSLQVPPPFPTTNLTIPKSNNKRPATSRNGHERRESDVKRKIQQYQRDLAVHNRMVAARTIPSDSVVKVVQEPDSPKLQPLGSPGPITPFELEEEIGGYLMAGKSTANLRSLNIEAQRQTELDLVRRMIDAESERARSPRARV